MSSRARPRVSNIFNKSTAYDVCLAPPILDAAHRLLGEIKVHGANLRDPLPGKGQQALHCDVPKRFEDDWWIINAMVLIDPMTAENGPTRIIPGSHRWAPINVPEVNAADWEPAPLTAADRSRVPADLEAPYPGEAHAQGPAGAVVICNGHIWHGGTTNAERRAPTHAAPELHAPRSAAAARAARLRDTGAAPAHVAGIALAARHRGRRGHRATLGGERPGDGAVAALNWRLEPWASRTATIASRSAASRPCGIGLPARRYQ